MVQNHKNDFFEKDENAYFSLAAISSLGDRSEQQDSIGFDIRPDEGIVIICDGMGGHSGGKQASAFAVDALLKAYALEYPSKNLSECLIEAVNTIDDKISLLCDEKGNQLKAGSTVVACIIRQKNLYWISVGDSRIYLLRRGELVQATQDHIYQFVVDEERARGLVTEEEYLEKSLKGEALVSFLGINGLPQIDINDVPFELFEGDKVILMSDGLYKLVSDEEILRILSNFNNIEDAIRALELKAQKSARASGTSRDNMSVAILKVK